MLNYLISIMFTLKTDIEFNDRESNSIICHTYAKYYFYFFVYRCYQITFKSYSWNIQ